MPLAHILAPQLIRKAQEIEDAIGPPRPLAKTGYLQAGYEKTPYDPKGLMDKPGGKSYDSSAGGSPEKLMVSIGQMQRSGDPAQQAFARGITKGIDPTAARPALTPNAPQTQAPAVTPPAGSGQAPKGKRVIQLPAGEVGTNDRGESVNARGKNLGYLSSPALVTPYGETPMRTGGRTKGDVAVDKAGGLRSDDKFGTDVVQRQYTADYEAVKENGGKYPSGYFNGMSAEKKKNIKDGVRALQLLEHGQKI